LAIPEGLFCPSGNGNWESKRAKADGDPRVVRGDHPKVEADVVAAGAEIGATRETKSERETARENRVVERKVDRGSGKERDLDPKTERVERKRKRRKRVNERGAKAGKRRGNDRENGMEKTKNTNRLHLMEAIREE